VLSLLAIPPPIGLLGGASEECNEASLKAGLFGSVIARRAAEYVSCELPKRSAN
jgi:hypothetical protein